MRRIIMFVCAVFVAVVMFGLGGLLVQRADAQQPCDTMTPVHIALYDGYDNGFVYEWDRPYGGGGDGDFYASMLKSPLLDAFLAGEISATEFINGMNSGQVIAYPAVK